LKWHHFFPVTTPHTALTLVETPGKGVLLLKDSAKGRKIYKGRKLVKLAVGIDDFYHRKLQEERERKLAEIMIEKEEKALTSQNPEDLPDAEGMNEEQDHHQDH
jgi:hypothetical protein